MNMLRSLFADGSSFSAPSRASLSLVPSNEIARLPLGVASKINCGSPPADSRLPLDELSLQVTTDEPLASTPESASSQVTSPAVCGSAVGDKRYRDVR